MIKVNEFIINEKLIKAAVPHFELPKQGTYGCPPLATKIIFADDSEIILFGIDTYGLYAELEKASK